MTKQPVKKPRKKKLKARITYLEMTQQIARHVPVPSKPSIALISAKNIPLEFYRFIYKCVGKENHWTDRLKLTDKKLDAIINAPTTEISILYADGCPAGYFEIENSKLPTSAELAYFGIAPPYQGKGLGRWFLSAAISAAWTHKPDKVIVHTNTLDHPAALPLYQKLGFSPYAVEDVMITPYE